jgi:hypothetical protein
MVTEDAEGLRVRISGVTVGSSSTLTDGVALWLDDGSGPARAIVAPELLDAATVPSGSLVEVEGPVGQRDSGGTGTAGYRVHATEPLEFLLVPKPSATPSPTPMPTPTARPTPTATPTPAPTRSSSPRPSTAPPPTASPSPTAAPGSTVVSIQVARSREAGSRVAIEGVVSAEAGRAGTPALVSIQDGTSGIFVRLPDDFARPPRGARLRVVGTLRDPYGQLEVKPIADGVRAMGAGSVPASQVVRGAQLGEGTEGRLVSVEGIASKAFGRVSGGDLAVTVTAADGTPVRVVADASSGVAQSLIAKDGEYRLTGILGQRASRKGASDGYRLWLRDTRDIAALSLPGVPGPSTPTGSRPPATPGGAQTPGTVSVARALLVRDGEVRVQAVVTVGATLLDSTGRRIVIEDGSAAVEVLIPAGASAPRAGSLVSVAGRMARAYGAPRIRATAVDVVGVGSPRAPTALAGAPGTAHEWRLVRVGGTIAELKKMGSRWRAELETVSGRVPIAGLAGAGIPAATLSEGQRATIVGIVRRPYPSSADRRFAIVPRSPGDVVLGPAAAGGNAAAGRGSGGRSAATGGRGLARVPDPGSSATPGVVDADLAELYAHAGRTVRVGGIVVELAPEGFQLDDGTAVGRVILAGPAADYLPLIEPEDPVNAIGRVEERDGAHVVVVEDPAGISRVGDLPAFASPVGSAEPSAAAMPVGRSQLASSADPLGLGLTGAAGIASLVLVSAASVAMTVLRRRRIQQALLARVSARLAAVTKTDEAAHGRPAGPPVPPH